MSPGMNKDRLQQEHYDEIQTDYEAHYDDLCSQAYRNRFIYEPMLDGLDLAGATVLEAMCGSGQVTQYLLSRGARVTGLDISKQQILSFRDRWPGCDATCASIYASGLETASFDCAVVVGGLHHTQPNVSDAILEIHRILKPGGSLCFAEPHRGSLPDLVRRFWYKHDRLFLENEESVDVEAVMGEFASRFDFRSTRYAGNLAYLFVLNSMVFRIPVRLKRFYTPALLALEAALRPIQGKPTACMVLARWVKRG